MASPLSGLLVVDLSRLLPGPLASRLLADLGARVVKVEEPTLGDPVRISPPVREGVGALAALLLAGVESIALDLKQPAGQEVLARLLERADVLLESFRPGTLARLGFPLEELRTRFPRLVICSLTGWGQDGPYAPRAGHDLTYLAVAGALASTAAMPPVQAADQRCLERHHVDPRRIAGAAADGRGAAHRRLSSRRLRTRESRGLGDGSGWEESGGAAVASHRRAALLQPL